MSSFLYGLGRTAFRRRGRVLLIWLFALVILGGTAALISKPFDEQFSVPGTESQAALDQLSRTFPQLASGSAQIVVVAPDGGSVRDTATRAAITRAVDGLEDLPFVDTVVSPFGDQVKGPISDDGQAAIIQVQLDGAADDLTDADKQQLVDAADRLAASEPGLVASAGGEPFANSVPALSIVEGVGVLVALVVLLITLGSFRAAGMPILTALLGVGLSMTFILGATAFTTVSSTTPLLAIMLGLAVGIDYALFIVSRHREQLTSGIAPEESVARATATAGSAVVFAGLTVIIALVGLAVARIPFLTVMGLAAAAGVAVAVLIALTLLPALLGFAGDRLVPRPRRRRTRATETSAAPTEEAEITTVLRAPGHAADPAPAAPQHAVDAPVRGWTGRWVRIVTRIPALTVILVVLGLGALALPARDLVLALPDAGTGHVGTPGRTTYDLIADHFGAGFNGPLIVTAEIVTSTDPLGLMDDLKTELEKVPGVADVPLATPNETADTGIVQVVPTTGPQDPQTAELVQRIRDLAPMFKDRYGVDIKVTGFTAVAIDISARLGGALLPFGIFVVGLSLLLLTMVFRSIWVPIKATLGFLLSVLAAFGATTLVFNQGHGASLINLEQPGPVISFMPILLMGILFGLAMDYEVFLVSRMREHWVHGESARRAVHTGFVASAKVVVAAAVIMFSVFAFFVPEGEGPIKPIAFGLAVGVFIDAFVVRMILVPAVLALLGERAWWFPKVLDRLLPSFDVEGEAVQRQLALADWPYAGADKIIYTEQLTVPGLAAPLGVDLDPGDVLVVEGLASQRLALLLALTGRARSDGDAKVCGLVLTDQAGGVRARAGIVTLDDVTRGLDPGSLRRPLLVLDRADDLVATHPERLAELIRDRAARPDTALVLGVDRVEDLTELLPSRTSLIRLAPPASALPSSTTHHHHEELADVRA